MILRHYLIMLQQPSGIILCYHPKWLTRLCRYAIGNLSIIGNSAFIRRRKKEIIPLSILFSLTNAKVCSRTYTYMFFCLNNNEHYPLEIKLRNLVQNFELQLWITYIRKNYCVVIFVTCALVSRLYEAVESPFCLTCLLFVWDPLCLLNIKFKPVLLELTSNFFHC